MFGVDVVGVVEVARKAAGVDVSLVDDETLMDAATGMAEAVSLLEATLAHVAGELDVRGCCERGTGLSVGAWLARESGLPKNRARRSATIGRGLRRFAVLDAAVSDGRLTVEHAAHVVRRCTPRVADAVAVAQDQIVEWAADCRFEVWAQRVSTLIELLDQDGPHDPRVEDRPGELRVVPTTDGVTFLDGRLTGADAVLVRQAIEAKADELFRRYQRDRDETGAAVEVPARSVLLAEALVELCRLANAREIGASKPGRPDVTLIVRAGEPHEPRADEPPRGDAANGGPNDDGPDDDVPNDEAGAGNEATGDRDARATGRGASGAARADAGGHEPAGAPGHPTGAHAGGDRTSIPLPLRSPTWPAVTDVTGVPLQDATTRALLCDPDIHALIVDRLGVPLDLGRTARLANDDQRRALLVRDGGCVFPGCDRPPGWCDAHHVDPYQPSGRTDLGNLALLCRRHHGITHRHHWTMHTTDDQWFWWTAPNGQTWWSQRHGHRRTGPTPP